jgi:DNA-binding response OmpR family regulator
MRLILAEDSVITRRALTEVCRRYGHDVDSVSDGLAAWDAYREQRHEIVVLDWIIPGIDGLEVCRRIRALDSDRLTYILIVTGRDSGTDVSAVLEAGADDYMPKPVDPDAFRTRLQIAEKRLAEREEHRKAVAALAHAQWLSGIGATTLALSHEINNPLQAILGEAQFLNDDVNATEEQRRQAAVILAQANRIADVVKRLSEVRSLQTIEPIPGLRMLDLS